MVLRCGQISHSGIRWLWTNQFRLGPTVNTVSPSAGFVWGRWGCITLVQPHDFLSCRIFLFCISFLFSSYPTLGETGGWWREKGGEEKDSDSLIRLPPHPNPLPPKNKTKNPCPTEKASRQGEVQALSHTCHVWYLLHILSLYPCNKFLQWMDITQRFTKKCRDVMWSITISCWKLINY